MTFSADCSCSEAGKDLTELVDWVKPVKDGVMPFTDGSVRVTIQCSYDHAGLVNTPGDAEGCGASKFPLAKD